MKTLFSATIASLCLIAGQANAAFTLDFDGSANGALIQNFYNGGTDSFGHSGINYGVTFGSGATVHYDHGRTYIDNIGFINVAGGFMNDVTFLYSTLTTKDTSPNTAELSDFAVGIDSYAPGDVQVLGNSYRENCNAYGTVYCYFVAGFASYGSNPISHNLYLTHEPSWGAGSLSNIAFDTITFGVDRRTAQFPQSTFIGDAADVSEPSTVLMMLLGAVGFIVTRKKQ